MSKVTKTMDNEIIVSDELLKVELVDIGEGIQGDYDENDPDDLPLLRFDVSVRDPKPYYKNYKSAVPLGDDWEVVEDASYCTGICAWAPDSVLAQAAQDIFDEYRAVIESFPLEYSVKRLGERLSYTSDESAADHLSDEDLGKALEEVKQGLKDTLFAFSGEPVNPSPKESYLYNFGMYLDHLKREKAQNSEPEI